MTNLSELAARIEAASADEQRAMLDEAFQLINGGSSVWLQWYGETQKDRRYGRVVTAMLDAEAYESAALMLVPEGWGWSIHTSDFPGAFIAEVELEGREHGARATTPALALACAALRAKEVNNHVKSSSMP